jgi:hypothetical protein
MSPLFISDSIELESTPDTLSNSRSREACSCA